ncbi:hypothetical protein F4859DRAFT_443667 [Xylaria cf. heliscus]|nr:hypothetical protein F4859DRAFT_443667 [Xylaria cf. heliscus]
MSRLIAIETHDNNALPFHLLLGTILGNVTKFTAITAFGKASANGITSIGQALQILLGTAGPELPLAGTSCFRTESVIDFVLLVQVALEIHVGQSGDHGLTLHSNQIHSDLLRAEGALQLSICSLRACLDVLLDSFFDIVDITLLNGLCDLVPSHFGRHFLDVGAIDLSWILAFGSDVAWSDKSMSESSLSGKKNGHTHLLVDNFCRPQQAL